MKYSVRNKNIVAELNNQEIKRESSYYQFGWNCFGPFLLGFTKWLDLKLKNDKITKIYFFSRDGYMMQKAYALLNTNNTKIDYVYFSRKSIRQALLYKCNTFEESLKYLSVERYVTLGKILEYYGFSKNERTQIARDNEWNLFQEYQYETLQENDTIRKIYEKLEVIIKEKSEQQRKYLMQYLKQINFQGNCAIVDIGWHGSMQYYLEKFCELNDIKVELHGYYVGIMQNVPLTGKVNGYMYSYESPKLRKSLLCFFGVLEKLFQSTEGSTYGYQERKGKIFPVCNTYEFHNRKECIQCIEEWQKGAIDFVKRTKDYAIEGEDYINLAKPLLRFGKYPSLKDIKLFSFFYNTDGVKEYYTSQKGLLKYKPKELLMALSNSVWKTGFMKSVFKIPLPYFYIYSWMKK